MSSSEELSDINNQVSNLYVCMLTNLYKCLSHTHTHTHTHTQPAAQAAMSVQQLGPNHAVTTFAYLLSTIVQRATQAVTEPVVFTMVC